ncbi:MAG: LysR family transcriptional regulator [Hyphomicrobiaceae bacterium]|nr:LysR family transcriptional regulator [Hyphomicrobiaceae bacterium]MCC0025041.1 LysR family transcriptional regulator [Hyphomicrobiaceae bacterium]
MPIEFTLKHLETFRAVVVAGSITKASPRIGLSQPSISQQIAKLEEVLNVQLLERNRTGVISLTPAGDYWFRAANDMLNRLAVTIDEHEHRFKHARVVLRLGATPALRGRFTGAAARIAQREPGFVKFELIYALSSAELMEMLRMHRLNFAIVRQQVLEDDRSAFAVEHLFEDKICWCVPAEVPTQQLRMAFNPDIDKADLHPALRSYVEIDPSVITRQASDDWFRHNLPFASPTFSAPTFASSVDFVVEGLATCHIPLSLLPNLTEGQREKLQVMTIDSMSHQIMLAMPKHLLTLGPYARIFAALVEFCHTNYAREMTADNSVSLTDLLNGTTPVPYTESA